MFKATENYTSLRTVSAVVIYYVGSVLYTTWHLKFNCQYYLRCVLKLVIAVLVSIFLVWHIGAGTAVFLMYRELTPEKSFQT